MLVLSLLLFTAAAGCEENVKAAAIALQQNNPAQVLSILKPLKPACGQSSAFQEVLGLANELAGNKTDAESALKTAVALDSKSPRLLTEFGATLLRNGKPMEAGKALDRALALDPANLTILKYAAGAAAGANNWPRAAELFRQMNVENNAGILRQDPILIVWLAQALIETKQSARLDAVLSNIGTSMPPALLFSLGTLFAKNEMYARAIDYLKQIPPQAADDAVYFNLGLSHSHLQQFDEAQRCYFEAIDRHPDHVEAYFRVGLDYIANGEPRMGIAWVYKAHNLAPERRDIVYALAEQLIALEYFDSAKQLLTQVFAGTARDPLLLVADGDLKRAQGNTAGAIASYREALAVKAGFTAALTGLARAHVAAGKDSEAERVLRMALSHDPQDPIVNGELGLLEAHQGNWDAAAQHLGRAWAQDRSNAEVALQLARASQNKGRPQDALQLLESVGPRMQDSSAFHFQLAQVYAALRRPAEAQAERDKMTTLQARSRDVLHFENPRTYVH